MCAAEVRVVDAFSFFNEIDLLDIRIAELRSVVSHTVVTEAPATFLGFPKPFFLEQEEGLAVLRNVGQDRLTYIKVEDLPSPSDSVVPLHPLEESTAGPWKGGAWGPENYQRNALMRGLSRFDDDDIVLIGDVDEIPRASAVSAAVDLLKRTKAINSVHLHQVTYHAWANNLPLVDTERANWLGTIAVRLGFLRSFSPQVIRNLRYHPRTLGGEVLKDSGWHLTWLGGALGRAQKQDMASSHFEPRDGLWEPLIKIVRDNSHNNLEWRKERHICIRERRFGELSGHVFNLQNIDPSAEMRLDLPSRLLDCAKDKLSYMFLFDEPCGD